MNEIQRGYVWEKFDKSMIGLCEWNVWDISNLLKGINQIQFSEVDTLIK